jgi:hypothetical protein
VGNVDHLLPEHEQLLHAGPVWSGISNERRVTVEPTTSLVAILALLILFAATSIRFGVDSREGFVKEQDQISSDSNSGV